MEADQEPNQPHNDEWCVINENEQQKPKQEPEQPNQDLEQEQDKPIDDLHMILILDESGSMGTIRNDIIGSINTFTNEQKELKKDNTTFTFVKFSTNVTTNYEKKLLSDVSEISQNDYKPNGNTALYDAIGITINKYADEKNVCMLIVTDGEENSSREFNHKKITELIEKKKNDNWKFIYLSADLSTAKQGANIGILTSEQGCKNTACNNIAVGYRALSTNIAGSCNKTIGEYRMKGKMKGMGAGDDTQNDYLMKTV
jgi:hypothetical protein